MDDRQPFLDKSDPDVWKALNGVSLAVERATLAAGIAPDELELLNVRVSQINGCSYCLDLHTKRALAAGVTALKLAQLPAWPDSGCSASGRAPSWAWPSPSRACRTRRTA